MSAHVQIIDKPGRNLARVLGRTPERSIAAVVGEHGVGLMTGSCVHLLTWEQTAELLAGLAGALGAGDQVAELLASARGADDAA